MKSIEPILNIASKLSWPRLVFISVITLVGIAMLNAEGIANALT